VVRALDIDPGAITVFVRIQTKGSAAYELSKKFGAGPAYAVELAERLNRTGYKVGLCFPCRQARSRIPTLMSGAGLGRLGAQPRQLRHCRLDVGGGFPAEYGHDPNSRKPEMPSLGQIMSRLSAT